MRKHALYASAVVAQEHFLSMSTTAQSLYFQLLCEAETDGELVNVRRVVRGTGLGEEGLAELIERGYLLEVGDRAYIRHNWVNNKLNQKVWKAMDSCEPYLSGLLEFEGIEGRSAYCLGDTEASPDRHPSDTQVTRENLPCNGTDTCKGTCTHTSKDTYTINGSGMGEGDSQGGGGEIDPHPCQCQKCGNVKASYFPNQRGGYSIECPECGTYEFDPHVTN